MSPLRRALVLVVPTAVLLAATLAAQGVTGASIYGTVTAGDSSIVSDVIITTTNTANGERWQTGARERGRYSFEFLSVGGPYTVEARAIGFMPRAATGITLSLGDRHRADFALVPVATRLAELTVTAPPDPRLNAGRTGPGQTISGAMAAALPIARRDFSQLVLLSPLAALSRDSGISIAGQSAHLNNLQIDGTNNSDPGGLHGISGFGTPGAVNRVRTVAVEAIEELQVLAAPFDVRYGNFAGGLVSVVTRSGSNRWEGSMTSYFQNQALTGKDSSGNRAEDFSAKELTLTLGGPVVRDRAAFFLDAGLQRFVGPRPPTIGTDTTGGADSVGVGVRRAAAVRFQDILRSTYGVDPGSIGSRALRTPAGNLFGKITLWPALNQRVELAHSYAHGRTDSDIGPYALSSQAVYESSTLNTSRVTWTVSGGGRLANELTLARVATRERCFAQVRYPEIDVVVSPDPNFQVLSAGSGSVCPDRFADQTTWELTDNVSWSLGNHRITVGTHAELIKLHGSHRVRIPAGRWGFNSLDSLEAGQPESYILDFAAPSRPDGPVSDFPVRQAGFYLQDQWAPVARLTLTAGIRLDIPYLPRAPDQNPALLSAFGINTAQTPSGNVLWSPRLGFNYDLGGNGSTFLRGGIGLFSGRPIYLYFSNIFETTGLDWVRVFCDETTGLPAFTIDPDRQPTECGPGSAQPLEVNFFNPAFRFPRNLRVSLGSDVRLPWQMVGTVDLLYTRGVSQFDITEVNLAPPTMTSAGEGGRLLYGSIDPESGRAEPNRRNDAFNTVAEMRNSSGDRAITASGQIQRRLGGGAEVSLAYTFTDARDRMSADCFNITCNLDFTPLDGSLDRRRISTSNFGVKHKVTLAAVVNLPLQLQLGLFYNGYSGRPYTYLVHGDANADALSLLDLGNDIMYIPRSAEDITLLDPAEWPGLDSLIRAQRCLDSQRGRIMRRNSCRGYWTTLLNTRLSRAFGVGHGQTVELTADFFNTLNLFDRDWGVQRTIDSFQGDPEVLELVGYDQANARGIYRFYPVDRRVRDDGASRWRVQLGAAYKF